MPCLLPLSSLFFLPLPLSPLISSSLNTGIWEHRKRSTGPCNRTTWFHRHLGTKIHASLRPKLPRSSRTIESRAKTAPLRATSPGEQRDERRARAAGSEASRGSRWPRWRCVDSIPLVLSCGPQEEQVSLTALRPRGKAVRGEGRGRRGACGLTIGRGRSQS